MGKSIDEKKKEHQKYALPGEDVTKRGKQEISVSDQEFFEAHPELKKKLLEGVNTPLCECVPEIDVNWDTEDTVAFLTDNCNENTVSLSDALVGVLSADYDNKRARGEQLEELLDRMAYDRAIEEYKKDPVTYTSDEVKKMFEDGDADNKNMSD